MKMRVQVVIESAVGESTDVHEIAGIHRKELRPVTLGLTLEEAKTVLERIQRRIVEQQAAEYLRTQSRCPYCGN
jgi:ribosomal protein L7/L12